MEGVPFPMDSDDLAAQLMEDMDPRFLELIRSRVNSFVKWDLVRFFHDNPHTTDTAENIARYTGRDIRIVQPELEGLVETHVIEATTLNEMIVYTYTRNREVRQFISDLLIACSDRQFLVNAL